MSEHAQPLADPGGERHKIGVLPSQALVRLIQGGAIKAAERIGDEQIQPASLDLRLGARAYRVRASFLPGRSATVMQRVAKFAMHEIDIENGAVLEKGCVYIVPLMESLQLRDDCTALGNPKSSTGRLDIFTRIITDGGNEFDRVRAGYSGPLYAEIAPRTFSILVRKGSRLSQLRVRRGVPVHSDEEHKRLQEQHRVIDAPLADEDIKNGVPISVDLQGRRDSRLIGYRAKSHAGLIDVDKKGYYAVADFWEPVYSRNGDGLILDPGEFYILASKEAVRIPVSYAAEMIAYDTLVGEFRVHYAGFFDPGFGDPQAGGEGARAVLEVRSFEVPFVIEHGQIVGRLVYEPLTETPEKIYGHGMKSHYQRQGLQLSKHFRAG
ncbi:MAG: 2'-deoxycytidine 5'-triphosphate deaminase [Gammaproteobacteria bacterium]|nr:2'-deoxycytidine 5'-triphosphate deaminase [Gammaproteobacteria bacterium]